MNRGGQADYAYYAYTDKSKAQEYPGWTQLFGRGDLTSINTKPDLWKSIHRGSYVRRVCTTCQDSHKDVIYKRLTAVGSIDFEDLFLSNWFDHPNGVSNLLGSDFNLFSNMNDATSNNNAWTFCNYNDAGIGFPRDCGPNGYIPSTWNSMNRGGQADYAYYAYTDKSKAQEYPGWTQLFGRGDLTSINTKPDLWKSIHRGSYVRRVCTTCQDSHKDVIYKRLTAVGSIDFEDLFLSNWFDHPNGVSNLLGSDFNLFSNMNDATSNNNAWTFCNYNDAGIGFPRDCGPNGYIPSTWNSMNRGGQADYAYYAYTDKSKAQEYPGWTQLFGRGDLTSINTKPDLWKSIHRGSYVRRVCTTCQDSHKDVIYKRLTAVGSIDFEDLFLSNWFDHPNGVSNLLGSDFNLFSNMNDATSNNNAWTFCNYNDAGIGFPRDCGPNGYIPSTWNSMNRGGQADYAYYAYTDKSKAQEYPGWTQLFGRGDLTSINTKPDLWKSIHRGSYVRRVCTTCQDSHKDVIYKRLTAVGSIDFEDLFLSNWFDHPNGVSNLLGSDFNLFSNMNDATSNNNAWTFCNYNDAGIGFPRDCGPNGYVACTWN
jgi:radical SAM superfamily enzyme